MTKYTLKPFLNPPRMDKYEGLFRNDKPLFCADNPDCICGDRCPFFIVTEEPGTYDTYPKYYVTINCKHDSLKFHLEKESK